MTGISAFRGVPARWTLPVALTLAGALIGYLVATALPRTYTAQSELFFTAQGGSTVSDYNDAASLVRSQMTSYAELVTSQSVLDVVARGVTPAATAEELARRVDATVPVDTVVLKIEAEAPTPEGASTLANAVAARVSEQAAAVSPKSAQGAAVVRPSPITQAVPPSNASWPSPTLFAGTGGFLGLLLGCVLAAILPGRARNRRRESGAHAAAI